MARKKELVPCVSYVRQPDGSAILFDDMTPEQQQKWRDGMSKKLGEVMSAYFSKHPEEYKKLKDESEELKPEGN